MRDHTTATVIHDRPYHLRYASVDDVDGIVTLEKLVWGSMAATEEMLHARIGTFPEGQIIAECENGHRIVGYISIQYVDDLEGGDARTWSQITDKGMIRNSHHREGQYIFGVNLSVHPDHPGVGFALQLGVWSQGVRDRKRGAYIGSRVPSYCRARESHPIEDWVFGENGKSRDVLVRYYQNAGFRIVRVLPDYFQDPESLDYGVLMYVPNCFRRLPFPVFWAFLIERFGFTFLRVFMKGD